MTISVIATSTTTRSSDLGTFVLPKLDQGLQSSRSNKMTLESKKHQFEYKTIPAFIVNIKSEDEEGENGEKVEDKGIVTHLISLYGNVDQGDDVSHKGMFTKTINERGDRIRVVDNHNKRSVLDVVGLPIKLYEVSREALPPKVLQDYPEATGGMMADTQFLLDTPEGKGTFTRLKAGAITEFSFAYDAIQYEYEDRKTANGRTKKIRHLKEVRLWEYGPVIFGMNDGAISVSAKNEGDSESNASEETVKPDKTDKTDKNKSEASLETEGKENTQVSQTSEVLTKEDVEKMFKALGRMRELNTIYDAFWSYQSEKLEDNSDSYLGSSWYSIMDVYDDHLIVEAYGKSAYYKVPYQTDAEGGYAFSEKEDWLVGTLEFIPTEQPKSEDDGEGGAPDTEGKELDSETQQLIEELKQFEVDLGMNEAEPDGSDSKSESDSKSDNEEPLTSESEVVSEEERKSLLEELEAFETG